MTLYVDPPSGNISWQKLECFAMKRLEFLFKVYSTRDDFRRLHDIVCEEMNVTDSECLIAGTAKDKISHFVLRLLIGGDSETSTFFCIAETALFDFQFSIMSQGEMNSFFYKTDKMLHRIGLKEMLLCPEDFHRDNVPSSLALFNNIKCSLDSQRWQDVVSLYMGQSHSRHFTVPFQCVTYLVSKRQVILERGMARVPFCKLREVLKEHFKSLMSLATRQACRHHFTAIQDVRMKQLWLKLKGRFKRNCASHGYDVKKQISLEDVDNLSSSYPLCAHTLLQSLRQKHRLGHNARVQLTLFLKEVGLPVHHALALWQQEYSKPPGAGSQCSHSWQTDGRRYTYNIRHLYGLEGSRCNFRAHSCASLQERTLGCNEEGGCPFAHWDSTNLATELQRWGLQDPELSEILTLHRLGNSSAACFYFFQGKKFTRTGDDFDKKDLYRRQFACKRKLELDLIHGNFRSPVDHLETGNKPDLYSVDEQFCCSTVNETLLHNKIMKKSNFQNHFHKDILSYISRTESVLCMQDRSIKISVLKKPFHREETKSLHFSKVPSTSFEISELDNITCAQSQLKQCKISTKIPTDCEANTSVSTMKSLHTQATGLMQESKKCACTNSDLTCCHMFCPVHIKDKRCNKNIVPLEIWRPVDYFYLNYKRLLDNLKS